MPWDPKPVAVQPSPNPPAQAPSAASNGMPPNPYPVYENGQQPMQNGGGRIKTEPGTEQQYHGLPAANSYSQISGGQGGVNRAQQLVEQQFGAQTAATLQQRGGLALPGQQQGKPQGLQLPPQNQQHLQQQYVAQQHAAMQRAQQQQLQQQQQQQNPRIKVENGSPQVSQGQIQAQQQPPQQQQRQYGQTDGADDEDDAMAQWQAMIAERRAQAAAHGVQSDHMMRERIAVLADDLQSGLMMPLGSQISRKRKTASHRMRHAAGSLSASVAPTQTPFIAQLDGDADDDVKPDIKDVPLDDDSDAINSDLDDPDDDAIAADADEDDDAGDSILCTYDKVQRVKNKWKCTLKDGVLNTGGREWLFHKGMGEFEW